MKRYYRVTLGNEGAFADLSKTYELKRGNRAGARWVVL